MTKLNVLHNFSSLQCHMILQKSLEYADLVHKKKNIIINVENSSF